MSARTGASQFILQCRWCRVRALTNAHLQVHVHLFHTAPPKAHGGDEPRGPERLATLATNDGLNERLRRHLEREG